MTESNARRRSKTVRRHGGSTDETPDPIACLRAAVESDARTDALCAQVRRTLEGVLAHEIGDPALKTLDVIDVIPAPTARRLRVVVQQTCVDEAPQTVEERLEAARGYLRSQVAGTIHRKRTPELVFELLPGVTGGEGDREGEEVERR